MNEAQKHSKAEMEMLKYERKMLRESRIKRLKTRPLKERIKFVLFDNDKKVMSPEEMKINLDDLGLGKDVTIDDIKEAMRSNQ